MTMLEAMLAHTPLQSVLVLGAHCDDIEIGCGATLLRLLREQPGLRLHWVVLSSDARRASEARQSAQLWLGKEDARSHQVEVLQFRNGFFPWLGAELKEWFEALKERVSPDLILTHHREDQHQDHRTVAELTWNTFRDHLILEYEIPKVDAGLPAPNAYVAVSRADAQLKVKRLLDIYSSQSDKHWFDEELFFGLMRLRGMECRAAQGVAEAFHLRKLRLSLQGAALTPVTPANPATHAQVPAAASALLPEILPATVLSVDPLLADK
jgi:LmbE family N-acetylglucosaminyl deacetylase